jgi:hypothetical protein
VNCVNRPNGRIEALLRHRRRIWSSISCIDPVKRDFSVAHSGYPALATASTHQCCDFRRKPQNDTEDGNRYKKRVVISSLSSFRHRYEYTLGCCRQDPSMSKRFLPRFPVMLIVSGRLDALLIMLAIQPTLPSSFTAFDSSDVSSQWICPRAAGRLWL